MDEDDSAPQPEEEAEEAEEAGEAPESSSSDEEGIETVYPLEEQHFHTEEVYCVCFSPVNQAVIVSGGGDNKAVVFDGEPTELHHHADSIISVSFSIDGKYLALGSMDAKVSIWVTGQWTAPATVFDGPEGEVTWVEWHPKGAVLAAGSGDGSNWVWDVKAQSVLAVLMGHEISSACGHFSPNGRYIYSGGKGVRVWDLKQLTSGQTPCIGTYPGIGPVSTVICISMREDNAFILSGHSDGSVQGLSITQSQPIFIISLFPDSIESVCLGAGMPWAAAGSVVGGVKIIDISSGGVRCEVDCPGVVKIIWKLGHIFVGCLDGHIREYEASSLRLMKIFKSSKAALLDFSMSQDRIIKSGEDKKVFLFNQTHEE